MPHYLNEDRELIIATVREFVENEVKPQAKEIDRSDQFPLDLFRRCGELGLTNLYVPKEYGGSDLDLTTFSLIIEEISKECATLGMCLIAHAGLAATVVNYFGTDEQKKKWLVPLAKGEAIGVYCMTEPTGISDRSMWTCTATPDGEDWIIDGTKVFCTNIGVAEYYVVLAVTGPVGPTGQPATTYFMVEKDYPGFEVGQIEDKVGWRGSNSGVLYFRQVRVPQQNMLGPLHQAATLAQTALFEMPSAGACALGLAEAALAKAFAFALNRPLGNGQSYYMGYESMRTRLQEMRLDVEAMRSFIYDTTTNIDKGEVDAPTAYMMKAYCFKKAESVCSQAIDLHGGLGVVIDTGIERLWRDAKVGMIGGGQYDNLLDLSAKIVGLTALAKANG
jgi:alkylation response protein AidB-like acyl-CoA dehydrogenase